MGISLKRLSQLQGKTISVVALVFMPRAEIIKKVLRLNPCDKDIRRLDDRMSILAISDRIEKNYNPFFSPEPEVIRGYARLLNTGVAYLLKALGKPTPVPDAFYR